jgi:undecaprenyl phosphate-alpha-L-ara4N flippase subunit ArnE
MTGAQWALAAATVAALAAGQILFKLAAGGAGVSGVTGAGAGLPAATAGPSLGGIALGWPLAVGLALYVGATGAWLALLRGVPLSVAYPAMALAYVIVPVLAHFALGEALRWQALAGGALIVLGVWLGTRGA